MFPVVFITLGLILWACVTDDDDTQSVCVWFAICGVITIITGIGG